MVPPPPIPANNSRAARAVGRAATLARISGLLLIILAGLSTLLNVLHPLTASFLISVVALGNGVVEWRVARRLRERDLNAPRHLSLNQLVLGGAIMTYSAWQAWTLRPAAILRILDGPSVRPLLDALSDEDRRNLVEMLPAAIRGMYVIIGVVGGLGCGAVALYYATRRKHLAALAPVAPASAPAGLGA